MTDSRQKQKTKKQLNQEALTASLEHRWEDAIALNDEILGRFPRDADAFNRKGRANMELGKLADARENYSDALKADPANMIARRNLQRLETIYQATGSDDNAPARSQNIPRANVFIEEIGKTWIDDLAHPAANEVLAQVAPGDMLKLVVEGERVFVHTQEDVLLGQVDQSIGSRMARFIDIGHEFEVFALGQTMNSLRVIIREITHVEESDGTMTFPRQDLMNQTLMREREQLSLRDESDFDFGDEDEEIEEEDEDEDDDEDDEDNVDDYLGDSSIDPDEEKPAE